MKAAIRKALIWTRVALLIAMALHPRRGARFGSHKRPTSCSFCDRAQAEVRRLIVGRNDVAICDRCVRLCEEILSEEGVTSS